MLAEDTAEHRAIFGPDGHAVIYFRGFGELVRRARGLMEYPEARRNLADAAHALVTAGHHTYRDRLVAMLAGREFTATQASVEAGMSMGSQGA